MKGLYNDIIKKIEESLEKVENFIEYGTAKTDSIISVVEIYMTKFIKKHGLRNILLLGLVCFFVFAGSIILWVSTFDLPNLDNFEERRVSQSTKIYDRTGDVVLFDVHGEITRTVIPAEEMGQYIRKATVAIEDANFYKHNGIEIRSIFRAIFNNLKNGDLLGGQGGSTITQQVLKNALLTSDKKISRKIKEWVLAPRLEKIMTKDEILTAYLNEVPYGGTVYGIKEAARRFFGKDPKDITLAESAYLASLPQLPTYYSPYGQNKSSLDSRKNLVLEQMLRHKMITQNEYESAKSEVVNFQKPENFGIKAPHFVMYVRSLIEEKYGAEAVEQGGLKVTTTLDWKLQEKAEEIVKKYALENEKSFNAENGSIVATDPNTGQVLAMVGSRDYFDENIDGNFNIALAERQPGSAFKPFVYAEAFNKGYRPETVVFDLPTEFSATCSNGGNCYNPGNYDNIFRGPMNLRNALAQSVNIPAVKVLYLAGIKESLNLAKKMGIETLTNVDQYGLTLVLGGGEVRPLDMAAAYGIFANGGIKHKTSPILKVEDRNGNTLEEFKDENERVLPEQTALLISDVLSDNSARTPAFGSNSYLFLDGHDVAVKTGTTNDYRDAWIVGYTPKISLAAWAGNNDNSSMEKKVAGFIVAPMWNEVMRTAFEIEEYNGGTFPDPQPIDPNIKPILAGNWNINGEAHDILHYVNKNDPLGPPPRNPNSDPQYNLWESAVQAWSLGQGFSTNNTQNAPMKDLEIISMQDGETYLKSEVLVVAIRLGSGSLANGEVHVNNKKVGKINVQESAFTFTPKDISGLEDSGNILKVTVQDTAGKEYTETITFNLRD